MPPLPLQTLNADVAAANADLGRAAESGRKKAAAAAFKQLVELLATSDAARVHAAMLRDNRLRDGESDDPTWDGVLSRVLFLLSLANKLSKSDVEKLRLLVGAAIGAGHGALTARTELKVFCFVRSQLSKHEKMPIRADKLSAHPESIGVLLQLTNGRPHLLARLSPNCQFELLGQCIEWITGEHPNADVEGEPNDDGDGGGGEGNDDAFDDVSAPSRGGGKMRSYGPHETVACLPELMRQYAQLLHQLVVNWHHDMPVLERNTSDVAGPLSTLVTFLAGVCERPPPHLSKMENLLWSAAVSAIVHHGANALHEVAAFGLEEPVWKALLTGWREKRGTSVADTWTSFVRMHLSCARLCGLSLPVQYNKQLSRLMHDDLQHATSFKRAAAMVDAADTSETTWRARSLLQLIADVYVLHRQQQQQHVHTHARQEDATEGGSSGTAGLTGFAAGGGSKRQKTAASLPLGQLLLESIGIYSGGGGDGSSGICGIGTAADGGRTNPSSTHDESQPRWLLLIGTILERHPAALSASVRRQLLCGLVGMLPTSDVAILRWDKLPLLAWCLGNLATVQAVGMSEPEWFAAWSRLHTLAALYVPSPRSLAAASSVHATVAASSAAAAARERLCFVDLSARCLRIVLTQRLLPPHSVGSALAALSTSPLFAPTVTPSTGAGASAASSSATAKPSKATRRHIEGDCVDDDDDEDEEGGGGDGLHAGSFRPSYSASAGDLPIGSSSGSYFDGSSDGGCYLRSLVELAYALCKSARATHPAEGFVSSSGGVDTGSATGGSGQRQARLVHWLVECMHMRPVQVAFESTSPWRCALQLRAERAAIEAGTHQLLLRYVFCRVVCGSRRLLAAHSHLLGSSEGSKMDVATAAMGSSAAFAAATSFALPGEGSWRSTEPSSGSDIAPPIPPAWSRRLAPPSLPPTDDDRMTAGYDAADEDGDNEHEAETGELLPANVCPPGALQLETFLCHIEALAVPSRLPTSPPTEDSMWAAKAAAAARSQVSLRAPNATSGWDGVLNGATAAPTTAGGANGRSFAEEDDNGAERDVELLKLATSLLRDCRRRVVRTCPGDAAGVGNAETIRSIVHLLRVAEVRRRGSCRL